MEKEFTEWFEANEKRFTHGQFDEKQIAYSAWLEGRTEALRKHTVVGRSEQLCECYDSHEINEVEIVEICCRCKKPTT